MPELPEVETIVRGLHGAVTGRRIAEVRVEIPSVVHSDLPGDFAALLRGESIEGVTRRAKFIVMRLGSGRSLVTHLRMTGRLIVEDEPAEDAYARVRLRFEEGGWLRFSDVRRFGRMRLAVDGAWAEGLGCEPLDSAFTSEALRGLLRGRRTPIKSLLLDQRLVAGVGNIYACEALYQAKIHPKRRAGGLSKERVGRLHTALVRVLESAIEMRGTSVDDYVDAEGLRGGFQNMLAVYGREGLSCFRCHAPIKRVTLAQRGTFYCPRCQR
ncbi:MAG TPA: bifunctional DNA-formamidopyrimidine glycosylase/DNA-(apurinic or apyrimidinic site) lyase [Candidatus Dormibacteraeota bacterium]|nr:bifunctional DNA-formamidopyrimidine glycosylase/DNA-(apurinic or apyrimidinic site) lyase [Candidatus Dormibacteraeota bacterium]